MTETKYPPAALEIAQKCRDLGGETQAAFDAFSSKAVAGAPSGRSARLRWYERGAPQAACGGTATTGSACPRTGPDHCPAAAAQNSGMTTVSRKSLSGSGNSSASARPRRTTTLTFSSTWARRIRSSVSTARRGSASILDWHRLMPIRRTVSLLIIMQREYRCGTLPITLSATPARIDPQASDGKCSALIRGFLRRLVQTSHASRAHAICQKNHSYLLLVRKMSRSRWRPRSSIRAASSSTTARNHASKAAKSGFAYIASQSRYRWPVGGSPNAVKCSPMTA
jgi:hypothetical protein